MSDNKEKKGYQDKERINLNEPYEVQYWCKKFNVEPAELEKAVKTVGEMAKDVEEQLRDKTVL